jgi:hypothetical protein
LRDTCSTLEAGLELRGRPETPTAADPGGRRKRR